MTPTQSFENGQITLYQGDARDIAPRLKGVARLGVFDAPYKLTSGGAAMASSRHKPMRGGWLKDYDNSGSLMMDDITWPEVMSVISDLLSADGEIYSFTNDKNLFAMWQAAREAGFKDHNLLPWDKISATANRWYMKHLEFALYMFRGRARRIADCSDKQLCRLPQKDVTSHPTEKPVALYERFIRQSARSGEVVTDPFLGSGTGAIACLKTGNPFIGIEKDPRHFDVACSRIDRFLTDPEYPIAELFSNQALGA